MKQVAPLRYDVIFKKAFGDPEMFTALVKDFLGIELEIDKVESDKAFIPSVSNVSTRFDLFAEDKKNRVIVEVQHVHYPDSYDRFLYYQCSAMVETVRSSSNYKFPITVMSLVFFTGTKSPNPESNIVVYDFEPRNLAGKLVENISKRNKKHKLIFVFTNSVGDSTPKNYAEWMRAINDSLDEEVNEDDYTNPNINRLFELIEKDQVTPEDRARMKDEYNQAELKKEGLDEGIKIGFDAGYAEAQQEVEKQIRETQQEAENKLRDALEGTQKKTARNLKDLGIADEQIASATGLSLDEIVNL